MAVCAHYFFDTRGYPAENFAQLLVSREKSEWSEKSYGAKRMRIHGWYAHAAAAPRPAAARRIHADGAARVSSSDDPRAAGLPAAVQLFGSLRL